MFVPPDVKWRVSMAANGAVQPRVEEERYLALLRAASAIACSNCDSAFDTLTTQLRDVTPFDYLHLVAFDEGSRTPRWSLLEVRGTRMEAPAEVQDTPTGHVYDAGDILAIEDWTIETRFLEHRRFLSDLGINATCTLPLKRGDRRLGVLSLGRFYPNAYDEDELRFLAIVADQIGLAIDAAMNFCESQRVKDQ